MKFGLDQLRTGLRPLERGRRPVRSWSKPNSITLSWSQIGARLVADLLARASELDNALSSSLARAGKSTTSLGPVCVPQG